MNRIDEGRSAKRLTVRIQRFVVQHHSFRLRDVSSRQFRLFPRREAILRHDAIRQQLTHTCDDLMVRHSAQRSPVAAPRGFAGLGTEMHECITADYAARGRWRSTWHWTCRAKVARAAADNPGDTGSQTLKCAMNPIKTEIAQLEKTLAVLLCHPRLMPNRASRGFSARRVQATAVPCRTSYGTVDIHVAGVISRAVPC
jgi:hypothetical protein